MEQRNRAGDTASSVALQEEHIVSTLATLHPELTVIHQKSPRKSEASKRFSYDSQQTYIASEASFTHDHSQSKGQKHELARFNINKSLESVSLDTRREETGSHNKSSESLNVNWTLEDVTRIAQEITDGTIAEVHLSLFAYWIRDKPQNYELAKKHIRELGLDQGYNIDRINNVQLRRLLVDTHHCRPVCVDPPDLTDVFGRDASPSRRSWREPLRLPDSMGPRSMLSMAVLRDNQENDSNSDDLREPFHAKQVQRTLSIASRRSSILSLSSAASHRTENNANLPLKGRPERACLTAKSYTLSPVLSPARDYPPNTPDRPAPLKIRSRSSQSSEACSPDSFLMRSFSTPIPANHNSDGTPIPSSGVFPRHTLLFQETVSHPLLTPKKKSNTKTNDEDKSDDVFRIGLGEEGHGGELSADQNNINLARRYASTGHDAPPTLGSYELDVSSADSVASYGDVDEFDDIVSNARSTSFSLHNLDVDFDELLSYVDSDGGVSVLETASVASEDEDQTQYSYASTGSPQKPDTIDKEENEEGKAPKSESYSTDRSSRKIYYQNPLLRAPNFHRPLPLRSYESEAQLYPMSHVQGASNHGRTQSVGSMLHSTRPVTYTTEPMPAQHAHSFPTSSTAEPKDSIAKRSSTDDADFHSYNHYVENEEQLDSGSTNEDIDEQAQGHHHSDIYSDDGYNEEEENDNDDEEEDEADFSAMLAAFPIPPMTSPMHRPIPSIATSPAHHNPNLPPTCPLPPPPLRHASTSPSKIETWRYMTQHHTSELMSRTRTLGALLPRVEWDAMSPFEKAWREVNSEIITAVYSRNDVWLGAEDVAYVEWVGRELKNGGVGVGFGGCLSEVRRGERER